MVTVSMQINENDSQLLGFMELNGPELYNTTGNQYGELCAYSHSQYLTGS
jgi:hypothetical protein